MHLYSYREGASKMRTKYPKYNFSNLRTRGEDSNRLMINGHRVLLSANKRANVNPSFSPAPFLCNTFSSTLSQVNT